MTFLKKLGSLIATVGKIAGGFAPTIATSFPGVAGKIESISRDLAQVADIIVTVEAIGHVQGLSGPQKLAAAAPLVAQVVLKSSIVANREIANPALFQQGATKIADGMADILNSLKDDVPTENIPT